MKPGIIRDSSRVLITGICMHIQENADTLLQDTCQFIFGAWLVCLTPREASKHLDTEGDGANGIGRAHVSWLSAAEMSAPNLKRAQEGNWDETTRVGLSA